MITLIFSILALIAGYFVYGKIAEGIFEIQPGRPTPAVVKSDGVDFLVLPSWKVFLIQFLNIAGLGPIFGAISGALWGPVAFLWIVLGSIFAGGVHDYFSGMLSVRHGGKSIAEISGFYLGDLVKQFMRGFTVVLMIMVGAVFVLGPAKILSGISGEVINLWVWVSVIFAYYILATILPIDKIISKFYPVFGLALLFMALGILGAIFFKEGIVVPELTLGSFENLHYHGENFPVFPMLFVTVACGAISGFHATQSPLMARCIANEKQGRGIFYGAMITEGIVALIWAAISMSFFGGVEGLNTHMLDSGDNAALVVNEISNSLLGQVGGLLAILGVVAAPITSGDTSFRSARIIVADFLKMDQKPVKNRMLICVPLFVSGFVLTQVNFGVIWRYFAWTNQTLATIVLWTITAYLIKSKKFYWMALIPAVFMTAVVVSYILVAPEGFNLDQDIALIFGAAAALTMTLFTVRKVNGEKELQDRIKTELKAN